MQLTIFDFLEIDTFFVNGAMYAQVPQEIISLESVELGDGIISPGQFVSELGEKDGTSFKMKEDYFLRYCGKVSNILLFGVNDFQSDYYYAFAYIDKNTLIIGSKNGCRDIHIKKLKLVNL